MDKRFREYLERQGMEALDNKILEDYTKTMTETVIPKITESIRQREQHAMELRFSPFATYDSKGKCD
ncbi:MAG: hypothetical protein OXC38_07790 [Gammaproteobacteria bacterium]|nr:hypothetical protein [Gammaproteobacteria bacterium]